ncbi:ubiquitin conjugating enzyme E2 U [Phyllostomus discolor]|uniref:Ubiquitin conjugating enzyme E2 U n=1 Tax=Phyllostomus discolor TaxID=89673 RepID=A0A834AIW1_9CHIR|nr:ubiquitin conjugating enzyme E2 U [Phyllostomus discolor]
MSCRAYFLLQRDFQELKENNYEGITAFPVSEDMMEWEAYVEGLQNTIWQGLFFQPMINFTSEYNFVPPVVTFRTIPFHPNVKDDSSELSRHSDKCIRSIKISFDDYYKPCPEIATSKAAECYRTPSLLSASSMNSPLLSAIIILQQPTVFTNGRDRLEKLFYFCQIHKLKQKLSQRLMKQEGWKSDDDNLSDSWEKKVEDLVTWTNTLDTDTLED